MTKYIAATALFAFSALAANAQVVYNNDFTTGTPTEWSNSTTETLNGQRFLGEFGNGTNTLNLSGLDAHSAVTVNFDLYILRSMDGNGPAGGGPDNFGFGVDGTILYLTNFANYTGGNTQAFGGTLGVNGTFAPRTGAFTNGTLGLGTGDFGDSEYRLSYTTAHSASSLAVFITSFQNQDIGDESWGIDNVRITLTPSTAAPEAGTGLLIALVAPAIGGLLLRRRARR